MNHDSQGSGYVGMPTERTYEFGSCTFPVASDVK